MLHNPYVDPNDDRFAQLCQFQIFFALLSSIALKYDAQGSHRARTRHCMCVHSSHSACGVCALCVR